MQVRGTERSTYWKIQIQVILSDQKVVEQHFQVTKLSKKTQI